MQVLNVLNLLEKAKFAKEKTIAYHVTSLAHLESILKLGLIAGKDEETGIGRGDHNSDYGYSYDPAVEGIYLNKNFRMADNLARMHHDKDLIVVVQVEIRTGLLDEDELENIFTLSGLQTRVEEIVEKYQNNLDEMDNKLEKLEKEYINTFLHSAIRHFKLKRIKLSDISVTKIKENILPHIKKYIQRLINAFADKEYDYDISNEQQGLMKALRHALKNENAYDGSSFVIPGNINYRGANKIIGFLNAETKKGWGKFPQQGYKRVEKPLDILK